MSVNDLSNQTNSQVSECTVASRVYVNTGTEETKLMEILVCAVGKDANNETNELDIQYSQQEGQDS